MNKNILKNYKGNAHELLCIKMKELLEQKGFAVEREKNIRIVNGPQKRYKVDVYGKRLNDILIFECGDCKQEKLDWLRENIGPVIHVPYLDSWCSFAWPNWSKNEAATQRLSDRKW